MAKRQIILDTETTGLETAEGHRIIEIGAVELIDRHFTGNNYHQYINPEDMQITAGAVQVHNITADFLKDKPLFADIVQDFLDYLSGADEMIAHNAPFDVGFLNCELRRWNSEAKLITDYTKVVDSLIIARKKHPGKPNSLDALCRRYKVDGDDRKVFGHGALLDARLLAEVYLRMTQGQKSLFGDDLLATSKTAAQNSQVLKRDAGQKLVVLLADDAEKIAHKEFLHKLNKGDVVSLWDEE